MSELLSLSQKYSKISIFGAGKMAQQVFACLSQFENIPTPRQFLVSVGERSLFNEIPVIPISDSGSLEDDLVIVATSRAFHGEISHILSSRRPNEVFLITGQEMEHLKKRSLRKMCDKLGVDLGLIGSMTNDYFWSSAFQSGETYSGNIRRRIFDISLDQAARFVLDNMNDALAFDSVWAYREFVFRQATRPGLNLEFGVADGSSFEFWASANPNVNFYGFDSFEGLPENWKPGFDRGRFRQSMLPVLPNNVNLVKGWFSDSLPIFIANLRHPQDGISFIHIDCDLYSSTKTVLNYLREYICPGTIIAFDEYFNYPGWLQHEHKAFEEFISETNLGFEYIAYVENGNQVAVRINELPSS